MSEIKLKPEVIEVSELLQSLIKLDSKTGESTGQADAFETYAEKQGISMDTVDKVDDVRTTFAAGCTHAAGVLSVNAMVSNKALERVTIDVPMGRKDVLSVSVDRHKEFSNHLTGGAPTEKYAVVSTQYDFHAGKNAGQLKKARLAIAELGLDKLK